MSAQDIILGSRVAHVRELKSEIEHLKAENARLHDENAALSAHFSLALVAAEDLRALSPNGRLIIYDGWNLVRGSDRTACDSSGLIEKVRGTLAENPENRAWIVFDGPIENAFNDGRLRVSYTGGTGAHRADKFICDFLRMARLRGDISRIEVVTHDKDFLRDVRRITETKEPRH